MKTDVDGRRCRGVEARLRRIPRRGVRTQHANGRLGCWMSRDRELAAHFGAAMLTATVTVASSEIFARPIRTLSAASRHDEAYHASWRKRLVAAGYKVALLVEICGRSDMMIVLDNSCVADRVWDRTA